MLVSYIECISSTFKSLDLCSSQSISSNGMLSTNPMVPCFLTQWYLQNYPMVSCSLTQWYLQNYPMVSCFLTQWYLQNYPMVSCSLTQWYLQNYPMVSCFLTQWYLQNYPMVSCFLTQHLLTHTDTHARTRARAHAHMHTQSLDYCQVCMETYGNLYSDQELDEIVSEIKHDFPNCGSCLKCMAFGGSRTSCFPCSHL